MLSCCRARARPSASRSSAAPLAGTAYTASPSNASSATTATATARYAWAATCAELGIAHRHTRPRRPQTNGKAEALVKTLLREWAYRFAYPTSAHRARALPGYLRWYNKHRPHSSLGGRPPISPSGEDSGCYCEASDPCVCTARASRARLTRPADGAMRLASNQAGRYGPAWIRTRDRRIMRTLGSGDQRRSLTAIRPF